MIVQVPKAIFKGTVMIPPSKSDAQRAILAAALAKGTSTIKNVGPSDDEQHMLQNIELLKAKVEKNPDGSISITGSNAHLLSMARNIGESGLGIRLLTPVLAVKGSFVKLEGSGSLTGRPMDFFDEVLPKFGVEFKSTNGYLPFELKGPMVPADVTVGGSQSSQYISGLLMALPLTFDTSFITVKDLTSKPYVEMTLNTLKKFGVDIQHENFERFTVPGNQAYKSCQYTVEGDWSSASYWLVASALGADVRVQGLSMSSLQADKKILDAFMKAGCSVVHSSEGLSVNGSKRHGFQFDATDCPDLFPALTIFAALTPGISEIKGVSRLKHKESNRGAVLQAECQKLGVQIDLVNDSMYIQGVDVLHGGTIHSNGDHRIAMAFAVAGMFSDGSVAIEGAEAVSKSYPAFWEHLNFLVQKP